VALSSGALIYQAVTPAPILGHLDPHGDGISALVRDVQGISGPDVTRPGVARPAPKAVPSPTPLPPRTGLWLEIPALEIALPVIKGDGSSNIPTWKALVYPGTVWPGRPGNSFIYAHAQWGMFANLLYARVGDAGYVHDYSSGRILTFHVSRVVGKIAYTDGTWLNYKAGRPTLTLMTCTDWKSTDDRYVVQLT
jgi:LPXTG-site transpeptidase (sortase) family protein